jgi:alkylation response protein AidB-like acyl-CoA dehydrogenase
MPYALNFPTLAICGPAILETGSEELKREHLPKMISGERLYCQFLSEPSGGSDLAGLLTRADRRDGDWVINGSKVWSSSAHKADYAMCLARTDWDVPKHEGLTMFVFPIHQRGVTVHQIEMVNGSSEFCQEFFDDLVVPESAVVGEVGDGWRVATRVLTHERLAVSGGSPYISGTRHAASSPFAQRSTLATLASECPAENEGWVQDVLGRAEVAQLAQVHLNRYLTEEMAKGRLPEAAGTMMRLFHAEVAELEADAGLELAGARGVSHDAADIAGEWAKHFLSRQSTSLGGGSSEMARNVIAERFLGMPREAAADRGIPFREVPHGH